VLPPSTRLFSADDHMIEPPHLWVNRVPERFKDRCPQIVDPGNGRQAWLFEDELVYNTYGLVPSPGGTAGAGIPPGPRHRPLR
jgi:hypothetical protein